MSPYISRRFEHNSAFGANLDSKLASGLRELIEADALQEGVGNIERSELEAELLAEAKDDALR